MVLPVPLLIEQDNGKKDSLTLPVEIWQRGGKWTFRYPSTTKIKSVTIDPDHDFPDINPANNTLAGNPPKPVAQGTTANDVINKYLVAIGGVQKINDIKDLSYAATGNVQGQDIKFMSQYKLPDHMLLMVTLPAMNVTAQKILVKGDEVTMTSMGNPTPVDDETKKQLKEEMDPFPEANYAKNGYTLQLAPMLDNIDGTDVYVITATSPAGGVTKEYFDANTGLKIRKETTVGMAPSTYTYSNYKEVNGIMFPYSEKIYQGVDIILTITDVKINSGLKDEDFK
jgi:outer membrane lipoprotein-sorting protein